MFVWVRHLFLKYEKQTYIFSAAMVLAVMFCIAFFSSNGAFGNPGDSGTFDETAHIPAGYAYVHDLDFRFNPDHPPLAKALSGLFMVLAGIKGPEDDDSWNSIDQWKAGKYMIFNNGNSAEEVYLWARLPIMFLMIALGIFLYTWSVKLYGQKIGFLLLTLYAFYPDIIAHGRLATTDLVAAFGYVITIYYFDSAISTINLKNTLVAGIAFGIALLCKMSVLALYAILFILVVVKAIIDKDENKKISTLFWLYFKSYVWICIISFVFVWMVYTVFVWGTPVDVEHRLIEKYLTDHPRTLQIRNFLHIFEGNRLTRGLGHYFLGILYTIGRVWFGNITFIFDEFSIKMIPWYFPVAWLLKTPIPSIVLFLSSVVYITIRFPREKQDRWTVALIATPLAVYWAIALISSLNIGIRHLLPTVPFALLLIGFLLRKLFERGRGVAPLKIIVFVLVGYQIVSTVSNYPDFIAYFNEATPRARRYTRLVDSSLDWGQDLLRLKKYVEDNNIKNIKLDYFGTAEPGYYIPDVEIWDSEYGPTTGRLAISAFNYQASKLRGELYRKWSYHWLDARKPLAMVGGSILVFEITKEELAKSPAESPYTVTNVVEPHSGRKDALFMDLLDYFLKHLKLDETL